MFTNPLLMYDGESIEYILTVTTPQNVYVNDEIDIIINYTKPSYSGQVSIITDTSEVIPSEMRNSYCRIDLKPEVLSANVFSPGEHTYTIELEDGSFTTFSFTASKRPSTIKASGKDISAGKDEIITATVPSNATGQCYVDYGTVVNEEFILYGTEYADVINGTCKIVISDLEAGKYTGKVYYVGDDVYLPSSEPYVCKWTITGSHSPTDIP